MHGISSLLDPPTDRLVRDIWFAFERQFGWIGAQAVLSPHFSWHVAEAYPFDRLKSGLMEIARQQSPFTINTAGLGLFLHPKPVLYLAIVVSPALLELHQTVHNFAETIASDSHNSYDPSQWVPHITLAFQDFEISMIDQAVKALEPVQLHRSILINNFAIVCPSPTGEMEICPLEFGGKEAVHVA
jgi:hypothetical protein